MEPSKHVEELRTVEESLHEKSSDIETSGSQSSQDGRETKSEDQKVKDEGDYPGPFQLALISLAMGLSIFISGLDNTIVGTATPTISNQFHSLTSIGWFGSAYQLTTCGSQFLYAKFYEQFPVKWVFIASVAILEIGSIVSATATNATAFIVGRAIAGGGSAGIISGTLIIVAHSVPLRLRPLYNGMVGGIECISMIIAPLIGGVFTSDVSWRWCFWINLPIGGFTLAVIFFLFTNPKSQKLSDEPLATRLKNLNIANLIVFTASIVCLLLALQWGGTVYPWNSGRVIAVLVVAAVAFAGFITMEVMMKDRATIPVRVVLNRTVALSVMYAFCTASALNIIDYFLPLWFQAVKGASAAESGVMLLPTIVALSISSFGVGFLVSYIGYYTPVMFLGTCLMAIGFGFFTTFTPNTGRAAWIGWQVMVGFGGGLSFSQPFTSAQTALAENDIAVGMSAIVFANTLGGAIFISVAQNIFANLLRTGLAGITGVDVQAIFNLGATGLVEAVPEAQRGLVIDIYSSASTKVFWISVALTCLHPLATFGMKWNSVKG
ncbi:MFS toxin efflux pump [Xylariales sp. PMI_506]|nr:MFS toxin efflux pump [Xylariales sp. PMI_506]